MMADTTDIEKKSLEAHVELCAERYRLLETKLEMLDEKMEGLAGAIDSIKIAVQRMADKRNDQLISWGLGVGAVMLSIIGYLIATFVEK